MFIPVKTRMNWVFSQGLMIPLWIDELIFSVHSKIDSCYCLEIPHYHRKMNSLELAR